MHRNWVFVLTGIAGVALVAAALLWSFRDARRRAPLEPVSTQRTTTRAAPVVVEPAALVKQTDCSPLPDGGLSCGTCRDNTDCPAASTCVTNPATGRTECRHPPCAKKEDCPEGTLCRVVGRTSDDEPLHACVPPGARAAGTACDASNGGDPTVSCGAKLVCVGGGCAPSCVPNEVDEPRTCPASHECVETEAGWGCIPTCKMEGCPAGKTCSFLSDEHPTSLCTVPDGPNCLGSKGGCPANTDCVVETNSRTERTTFRCYPRCSADSPCADGSVCVPGRVAGKAAAQCRRGCAPGDATSCGPSERCVKAGGASGAWFCSAT